MDLIEAKKLAKKTLDIVHPLIKSDSRTKAKFENVVLGTLRRDYMTLFTIYYLADSEENKRIMFGDPCLDLARRVFEDLISIEYIKFKGKEEYSKQFIDYKAADVYRDFQYLESSGIKMDTKFIEQTKKEFNELSNKQKKRNRWLGTGVEGMIETLLENGVIKPDEFRTLSQVYNAGNYKNHFSPTGILNFLNNDLYEHTGKGDLLLSMVVVAISITKIAGTLIEEYGETGEDRQKVDLLWKDWTTAHLRKDD